MKNVKNINKEYFQNLPTKIQRIAVFASFNKENIISEYVIYYLTELKKVVDAIIFVADNPTTEDELKKIENLVVYVSCYNHKGYDFGSYRIGYEWAIQHRLLWNIEELIFLNDSCYGPVFPFENVFSEMDKRNCDFWGLVDSYEPVHHIQSFFMAFRQKVLSSLEFCNFVNGIVPLNDFWDYVNLYERRFTKILEESGFNSDVYIKPSENDRNACAYWSGNGNMTLFPVTLHEYRMPLVKIKAMNGKFGNDLHESPQVLMNLIEECNPKLQKIIKHDLAKKNITPEDKWLTPKEIIGNADVVSFDIFDTLLARPYSKPTDLFLQIEHDTGRTGFHLERINAEKRTRKIHRDQKDVTFAQIYEVIEKQYKDLAKTELQYESETLFAKADGKSIYEEAVSQGKRIIAISDMYLPQSFLTKVLHKNGYTDIEYVFVSNEENACKGDGRLFTCVMDKLGITPSQMVHIGDNSTSDKQAPERLGIRACLRPSNLDIVKTTPALSRLHVLSQQKELYASILTGIIAKHKIENKKENPLHAFGYELGGPLAVGYAMYINEIAKKEGIDGILFVSRDGYAVHKVYEKLFPNGIKGYYIQASRNLVLRNKYKYDNPTYTQNVYNIFAQERLNGEHIPKENYHKYESEIKQWTTHNEELYNKYVNSLGIKGNKLMTVDMTTREYTSLNIMKEVFGDKVVCGMFSIIYGIPSKYKTFSYATHNWRAEEIPYLTLEEELITAPECSAYKIQDDDSFLFKDWHPTEQQRVENYKVILEGIIAFAEDFNKLLQGHHVSISYKNWTELVDIFMKYHHWGSDELLKKIYHDDGFYKSFQTMYDTFYNKIHPKETTHNVSIMPQDYLELQKLRNKRIKHLKTIRKLIFSLGLESAIIVFIIAYLFIS